MRRAWLLMLIVAGLLAGMAATRWLTAPPPLRAENAPGQFDAKRAKARLERIIGPSSAHPADSAASDGVRARLVAELRSAGLNPRVDDRFACNKLHKASGASCARVRNVLVTIGRDDGRRPHLLVNTHYDSVPVGPGASDAGIAVASMIEVASLLRDRPLARPVTFLFNEGEELGLVGARAFLDGDPLSRRVDALLNLEARGTTGPVNMFETSTPNAAAIRLFERSVSRPVANSLAVSAYRLIPNYTDVNSFVEERDWLFLNFAPIGNETRYHSPGDDLAAVDMATLQHMGDQLLETASALASGPTPARSESEKLFMNIGTRWLFTSHGGPAVALFFLVGLLAVAAGSLRRKPRNERAKAARRIGAAALLLAGALLLPVALAWAGLSVLGELRGGQFWRAYPKVAELAVYAGVIAGGLLLLGLGRRLPQGELRAAWWGLFLILGLGFSLAAPGALVYFILPPLAYLLVRLLGRRWRHHGAAGSLLAALITFVTLGAMLGLLQDLVNNGPLWIFALFGGLVLMPWLIEARPLLEGWRRRRLVPAALAFAGLAWVPAALVPAYSADRQQAWTTQYVLEEGKAPTWSIVNDRKPLPSQIAQLGEWRQGRLAIGQRLRWIAPAPVQPGFVPPELERIGAERTAGGRIVRVRLRTNGADSVIFAVERGDALKGAGINGRTVRFESSSEPPHTLTCTGRSCNGAVAEFSTGSEPLDVQVIATHWRLPPAAGPLLQARPAHARPQYLPNATILARQVRL